MTGGGTIKFYLYEHVEQMKSERSRWSSVRVEVQTGELKGRSQSGQELSVSSSEPPHLFWSLVGVFPAGEAERPNHDIAAAQTQQEVEEEVVSVPVTHLALPTREDSDVTSDPECSLKPLPLSISQSQQSTNQSS